VPIEIASAASAAKGSFLHPQRLDRRDGRDHAKKCGSAWTWNRWHVMADVIIYLQKPCPLPSEARPAARSIAVVWLPHSGIVKPAGIYYIYRGDCAVAGSCIVFIKIFKTFLLFDSLLACYPIADHRLCAVGSLSRGRPLYVPAVDRNLFSGLFRMVRS